VLDGVEVHPLAPQLIRYEDLHSARGTANGDRRAYRRRSRPMLGQVDGRQTVEAADDIACTSKPIQAEWLTPIGSTGSVRSDQV
jgi:hypothetical protein